MTEDLVRFNIRLSREVHQKLMHLLPWGLRRNLIETVLKLILDAIERDGIIVAGAIMDGKFALRIEDRSSRPSERTEKLLPRDESQGSASPNPDDP